jgi:hypothetical protein
MPTSKTFFGSQVGGKSVINYSYTDLPWRLLGWDVFYFCKFFWALPYILLPITPSDSGDLDELSFTVENIFCVVVHAILVVLQLLFVLALPLAIILPIWMVVLGIAAFLLLNNGLCMLLNGEKVTYQSDPKYARALPQHAHEQWIFINGVAVGYESLISWEISGPFARKITMC